MLKDENIDIVDEKEQEELKNQDVKDVEKKQEDVENETGKEQDIENKDDLESKDESKEKVTVDFDTLLNDKIKDEKFKEDLISNIVPDYKALKDELLELREAVNNSELAGEFTKDPKKAIEKAKIEGKKIAEEKLSKEYEIKERQIREELIETQARLNIYVEKEKAEILNGKLEDGLKDYEIIDGARKDILEILKLKYKVNDDMQLVSMIDEDLESKVTLEEYIKNFFEERPYFINKRSGSNVKVGNTPTTPDGEANFTYRGVPIK